MADHRGMRLGRHPAQFEGAAYLKDLPSFGAMPNSGVWSDFSDLVPQWPMLKNDELGDCAEAGLLHMLQAFKARGGQVTFPDDQAAVELYSASSGYVVGQPSTDQGSNLTNVLAYAKTNKNGVPYNLNSAPEWVRAYAYLQHTDLAHVTQCIANFIGIYIGVMLRQSQMTQDIWDADSSLEIGGHCVYVVGANAIGPKVVTWGEVKQCTWAWWTQAVEEAWVVINYDFCGIGAGFEMLVNEANALTKR